MRIFLSTIICKKTNIEIRDILESLQDKGLITKAYKIPQKGETFNPYEVTFNQNFIKNCHKASFEMGRELFEIYPQFANINGVTVPLRSVSKKFDSLEDFFKFYAKSIRYNPEVHNNILRQQRTPGAVHLVAPHDQGAASLFDDFVNILSEVVVLFLAILQTVFFPQLTAFRAIIPKAD